MTRLLFKTILISLFFSLSLHSQNVSYSVKGNRNIETSRYLEWLGKIRAKSNSELRDSIITVLARELSSRGFFDFQIDSLRIQKDSSLTKVKIVVNEGSAAVIEKIVIDGLSPSDSLQFLPFFNYLSGTTFSKVTLEKSINLLLSKLENEGYPFASVKIEAMEIQEGEMPKVTIHLKLEKGKLANIDEIEVLGNTDTEDYVITREFRLTSGEKYSRRKIEAGLNALKKLDYFKKIFEPKYFLTQEGKGILEVNVEEKSTNSFDGVLGYVPSNEENKSGYLTGYLNISLRNILGTGRAFAFKWLQENKFSQELEVKYLEPWVFNFPVNILTTLYQRKQDSSYVKRELNFAITYLASNNFSLSALVGFGSTMPTLRENTTPKVFNSSAFSTGVVFQYDSRDNIFAPTLGAIFRSSYNFTQKKIFGPKELLTPETERKNFLQKLELNFAYYRKVFANGVLAANVSGRELKGTNLDVSDLYKIGGANTIRGYREKQFACNRALWSNLEFRLLFGLNFFGFLFYDFGYLLESKNFTNSSESLERYLSSYGIGFSLSTALGILKVSYAVALGSSLNEGFIHFGLFNRF